MINISIAMATYNGAEYIDEQLESIATQDHIPNELVVCDDKSTDNTISLIQKFSKNAPFPVRILVNEQNMGPIDNFFKAATHCLGDWICYCDQDDVWLPKKISDSVKEINTNPNLNLILQRAKLTDSKLNEMGVIFPQKKENGIFGGNQLDLFFEWHGFLQTVRADFFTKYDYRGRPINKYRSFARQSHDQWTCMIANSIGGISILQDVSALYRRHSKAVTGSYTEPKAPKKILPRLQLPAASLAWQSEVCSSYAEYIHSEGNRCSLSSIATIF